MHKGKWKESLITVKLSSGLTVPWSKDSLITYENILNLHMAEKNVSTNETYKGNMLTLFQHCFNIGLKFKNLPLNAKIWTKYDILCQVQQ